MNSKRWIAIGLSLVVFVSSLVISMTGSVLTKDVDKSFFWEHLIGDKETEIIIRDGDLNKRIAVLDIRGTIISSNGNIFGLSEYNHSMMLEKLERIRNDDTIKALIMRVNSPGGGVYESSQLRDKIKEVTEEKEIPFYVVMESMAASGGYYISVDADKIYASNDTITGSIGVIMSGLNLTGLMEKLGVDDMTIKSGDMKDVGSSTRKATQEDLDVLQGLVNSMYERFVDAVEDGRQIERNHVYAIADGRIYDGKQALDIGLIDAIGYYDQALQDMEVTYGFENSQIIEFSGSKLNFSDHLMIGRTLLLRGQQGIDFSELEMPASWQEKRGFMYLYGGY